MHVYRSHTCAELNQSNVGDTVRLSGWVHRIRDHGGILFVDLRDHYGMTQVLCDPDSPVFSEMEKVRAEWCIRIDGTVKARDPELVNPKLPTGEIEVFVRDLEVLGAAAELPLMVFGDQEYPEETRLKYRYLDLRRDQMQKNMVMRSQVVQDLRQRMWDRGFNEFQTPIITASSPEGARDFLVPSRLHPGKFYALPQAPQQFKQLLMVSGFDKYFQVAPCFRDEDPRADRSPTDFYQLDMEMSFVTQQDIFDVMEPVIADMFDKFGKGRKSNRDWPQISYKDAALWYGTDKPDLRNPIKMQDVSEHFRGSGFAIFAKLLEQEGNEIRAIPAPKGGSRKFCDRMNKFAQQEGLPGMGYIFWRDQGNGMEAAGPLAKNIGPERTEAIRQQLGLEVGDAAFFLGGKPKSFERVAGKARTVIWEETPKAPEDENWRDKFMFAWIVDFPIYEQDEETGEIDFEHNPFSMPQGGMEALEGDPLKVLGWQYDLACNGYELVSGAIRNHQPEIMFKAFELAGYGKDEVEKRFGGMVNAFQYGAPPHGGCALGIDRAVMILADQDNIREVMLFPMNQRAEDLMMGAPSEPTNEQLRELNLRVIPQED
ncbi:aspartate--tRNA ligase [Celeribacter halophilus]|jgi:aspartyl-tRNA synthetase|uniref:Aspartate--tRNA(Asp/Asn) ligase n=1 Tax=Celeribacter halophilus TaxID=576117 RepID=A0AAW7XTL6_9RHOB|nr:aspartate--tRNA ligase [Celeribacter halophilus]MBU2891202.1 aspartate--tRNA ligase [Celeribacter halophilus]MDO6456633.1 aspartate--tRNA ligase [Celeribacter halophilus]MDO6510911.1 aspartate--tRNA ligase [Celeribacter halophilus]MDO6723096.1 aspartate--tRNA ligase [Celeribacter halophilus]